MLFKISYGNTVPYDGDMQETPAHWCTTLAPKIAVCRNPDYTSSEFTWMYEL